MKFGDLQKVREEVAKYDRHVTLIAATKTQTSEDIDEFMSYAPDFVLGENRVQEFIAKYNERYIWHFIGRLQTNKVKYIIDKAELIHSLDRRELAAEIEKQADRAGKVQACLVELNMGAESAKGGICPENAVSFIESLAEYSHIRIEGVMSVLPDIGDCDELHGMFEKLYSTFEDVKRIAQSNLDVKYLSAGMTNDYKIALAHGANMIRLGRALFGERRV